MPALCSWWTWACKGRYILDWCCWRHVWRSLAGPSRVGLVWAARKRNLMLAHQSSWMLLQNCRGNTTRLYHELKLMRQHTRQHATNRIWQLRFLSQHLITPNFHEPFGIAQIYTAHPTDLQYYHDAEKFSFSSPLGKMHWRFHSHQDPVPD